MDIQQLAYQFKRGMEMLNEVGGHHIEQKDFHIRVHGNGDSMIESEAMMGLLKLEMMIRIGSVN